MRSGDRVTLSGSVPDRKAKTTIAAAAKGLGLADVLDRTTYGRGESDALPAAAEYAMKMLANFTSGAVTYTNGSVEVNGEAADAAGYAKALALLKAPPQGVKVAASEVTPPKASPFVFSAAASAGN